MPPFAAAAASASATMCIRFGIHMTFRKRNRPALRTIAVPDTQACLKHGADGLDAFPVSAFAAVPAGKAREGIKG